MNWGTTCSPGPGYGADAVTMHGATPDQLEPIVAAYRAAER
jgi:hypothetical protein